MVQSILIGVGGGAALALVQHIITRALAAVVLGQRRGAKLLVALKMPLSLAVLVLFALISREAVAAAAVGFAAVCVLLAFRSAKRRDLEDDAR